MRKFSLVNFAWFGIGLVSVTGSVLALSLGLAAGASPADASSLPCRDGGDDCINIGFTDAWFGGQTVQLEYSHQFFCARPPKSTGPTGCEVGDAGTTLPPSGPVVSNVYLIVPVGFAPPDATLHCPIPGQCIDNPHTMDLSRIGGGHNAILPAHSIVIEDAEAFQSTWWPVVLVRVKNLDAWNAIAAAKTIDAVDECQANGGCFAEEDSNAFLFFQVLGPEMSPQGPP